MGQLYLPVQPWENPLPSPSLLLPGCICPALIRHSGMVVPEGHNADDEDGDSESLSEKCHPKARTPSGSPAGSSLAAWLQLPPAPIK